MDELTLYSDAFWISPYAFTCFVALREKDLPFELKALGLHLKEHHDTSYRESSLTGRVPALRHGDFWVSESSAITEYLDEAFPAPKFPRLFPEDIKERARARQLMAWVRSDLAPIREERPTTSIFYEPINKTLSPAAERAVESVLRVARLVISETRTTLFSAWCIADADFGLMLQRLNINGYPLPPKVKAYAEAQWARPSAREFIARERPTYVPY